MMQQYREIKACYQDAILFFRLGDFYEMFGVDAEVASKILEIALTGRDAGSAGRIPMCGIPFHAADNYIAKLLDKGFKVAICEQVEDPKQVKGIVRREVIRVVSPGSLMEASLLEERKNNYIACVVVQDGILGLSFADISTGEFKITELSGERNQFRLMDELARLNPAELLLEQGLFESKDKLTAQLDRCLVTNISDKMSRCGDGVTLLNSHFGTMNMVGFGCEHLHMGIKAAAALLSHLKTESGGSLAHLCKLTPYSVDSYMLLDQSTRRNLELTRTIREHQKKGSLLGVLDCTVTAMGARLLKQWLEQPLVILADINERLLRVEAFQADFLLRSDVRDHLDKVYDMERLIGRVVYGSANAKDMLALKNSLQVLPHICLLLEQHSPLEIESPLQNLVEEIDLLEDIFELLEKSISLDAPFSFREGGLIKTGFNSEIDELRYVTVHGKEWMAALEAKERERTGIKSLKVGYNKVFGYYLEVTQANVVNVPVEYIRKQTLANAERYITPELKEAESKILGAEEKLVALEYQEFCGIRESVAARAEGIQKTARALAALDVLSSLAETAVRNNYTKPKVLESGTITILEGRHPVVEKVLAGEFFVSNDTTLDVIENRLAIITGPNMAGKSTYMRQVALIVLMAQMGSYVPAQKAEIGLVDRIFTRVGASDDLSTGQSTFMVEMNEVANILNNATSASLIILDEIGRGTATYDGLSIAWAVAEYIHSTQKIGAKTLFATHYHELTELAEMLPGVCNYRVVVKEKGDTVVFLRKIVRGSADRSYGIQVARLAGLPTEVISRAKTILASLESQERSGKSKREVATTVDVEQLSFALVEENDLPGKEILTEITAMNLNSLTPLDALYVMARWQKTLKG